MRRLLVLITLLVVPGIASAAVFECRVKAGAPMARFTAMCDMLRVKLGDPPVWNANKCCTKFMERGMIQLHGAEARKAARRYEREVVADSDALIDAEFPAEVIPTPIPTATPIATPTATSTATPTATSVATPTAAP